MTSAVTNAVINGETNAGTERVTSAVTDACDRDGSELKRLTGGTVHCCHERCGDQALDSSPVTERERERDAQDADARCRERRLPLPPSDSRPPRQTDRAGRIGRYRMDARLTLAGRACVQQVVRGFTGMGSSATVDVTFARDTRPGLWLPAKTIERHVGTAGRSAGRLRAAGLHTVTATATCSDFKRFETATSVVIEK